MATYEEVMTALRNADAAGDSDAATRLAGIAKRMKTSSSPSPSAAQTIPDTAPESFYHNPEKDETWADKYVRGPIEAGANLATGAVAGVVGPLTAIATQGPAGWETAAGKAMEELTYAPRGSAGQRYSKAIGDVVNSVGIPLAGHIGLPKLGQQYANHAAPSIGAVIKERLPAAKTKTSPAVSSALADLNAPETPVAEAPLTDARSSLDKSRQMYEAEMRARELQKQSAFHRPEQLADLEAESPMNRMVRELGGEPEAPKGPETPMSRMAEELTAERSTPRQREVQEALEARQAELDSGMRRRVNLEKNAAELQRLQKLPAMSDEFKARLAEQESARIAKDAEKLQAMRQMEIDDTQHVLPESNEVIAPQYGAMEGVGRIDENGIPIKADLSMEAANLENPLQRNLWGDELAPKSGQENPTPLTQAIDTMTGESRAEGLNRLGAPLGSAARAALMKKQGGRVFVDWSSKKKLDTFSEIPGIKQLARDIGNAMIKTPQEAVALAKKTSDVAQNAVQRGFNAVTKGGTYLKTRVNNPVVHFTVDRFLQAEGLAKGEITQKLGQDYLGTLRDLTKEEYQSAFELLNAADLNKKTITPEFMQKHGLSTRLQEFLTTHQRMMDDVLQKINTAREASGKPAITAREAYSAMSMSGDYRKVVYKNIDGIRTVVGVIGADRLKGKVGWTIEKIEKHLKDKDPSVEFGAVQDVTASRGGTKGTPHDAFTDALKTLGENNPHVAELLDALREVAKDAPSNYMGMQKHTMQKKGVWGMEGRKPWETAENNATQFFENQVRYIESAFNWSHLSEAARDVNSVLRDESVLDKHKNAVALSDRYMQNALGFTPSRAGRGMDEAIRSAGEFIGAGPSGLRKAIGFSRSAANTAMLSLNQSFLAIQAIQGPAGIPAMTALLRGRGLAPKRTLVTLGLDSFVEANKTLVADKAGQTLSSVDRGALDYAKKHHIYATDMVEHNSSTKTDASYYISKVAHSPAAVIETVTRAQTYLTFVKMMDESGLKPKDGLYEQAHRLTDQVMNNYSAMEKPPVYQALGQLGSMAYNLKSFGHNELSRWAMLAREIPATGNAMPLLTQMATTLVLAGTMGLPFYSQFEELYDYITKKMGEPRSLTLDVIKMSENMAKELGPEKYELYKNTISHGLPSVLGMDISKRVGLSDVVPSNLSDAAFAGGSKLSGIVGATAGAIANPDEQHLKAAAVAVAPSVVASPLKSAWYTDEKGVYSTDPDKKRELITQINGTDRLLKSIGFTGINESTKRAKDYQLKQIEKAYQDIRNKALIQISYDLSNNKPISQETIDKYFVQGQGDPSAFGTAINDIAMKLNVPRDTMAMLQSAASNSITKAQALNRRVYANE